MGGRDTDWHDNGGRQKGNEVNPPHSARAAVERPSDPNPDIGPGIAAALPGLEAADLEADPAHRRAGRVVGAPGEGRVAPEPTGRKGCQCAVECPAHRAVAEALSPLGAAHRAGSEAGGDVAAHRMLLRPRGCHCHPG